MPGTRQLTRVLPDGEETREYTDLGGAGLAAHVAKHVLTPEEHWPSRLGIPVPRPSNFEAVKRASRLLQAGEALENIRYSLRGRWGENGDRVLERLFCEGELSALRRSPIDGAQEVLDILSSGSAPVSGSSRKPTTPSEIVERARTEGILPLLMSTIVHLDLTDRLLREADPGEHARKVVAEARKLMSRQGLFSSFLTTWVLCPDQAAETIRDAFGGRYAEIAEAYLDAAHTAARSAGVTPRHCTYDLSSGLLHVPDVEGYVDEEGVAVVIGPDGSGGRRLYTAHVPTTSRSRGGKLGAATRALLRSAWGPSTPLERKLFLEELDRGHVVLRDLHSIPRWRELR